jgi:hypothetical protein
LLNQPPIAVLDQLGSSIDPYNLESTLLKAPPPYFILRRSNFTPFFSATTSSRCSSYPSTSRNI